LQNAWNDLTLTRLADSTCRPISLARDSAGNSIAAKMAMIAITISKSISVNGFVLVLMVSGLTLGMG
jgi:hypothetical protein